MFSSERFVTEEGSGGGAAILVLFEKKLAKTESAADQHR
jgi:hypothetical protein